MSRHSLTHDSIPAPMLIHRWFSDGAALRVADELKPLREQWNPHVSSVLSNPVEEILQQFSLDSGLLLLSKTADRDCPDPRAVDRGPTILRGCLLTDHVIRSVSVDHTAVMHLAYLLLPIAPVSRNRQDPCQLHLQIPRCQPDFQLPMAADDTELSFRTEILNQTRSIREMLQTLLQTPSDNPPELPVQPQQRNWLVRLFSSLFGS